MQAQAGQPMNRLITKKKPQYNHLISINHILIKSNVKCEKCGKTMNRIPEVVDCWVESGSMPFAELHYPFENEELFQTALSFGFCGGIHSPDPAWFYVMHVVSRCCSSRRRLRTL